ncbi:MAG: phosducin-like protein [Amphiamblys sp. WSBS2006]|nr:MAG: phosducin-like protein [Amphiamblys sp. WSBS2006]
MADTDEEINRLLDSEDEIIEKIKQKRRQENECHVQANTGSLHVSSEAEIFSVIENNYRVAVLLSHPSFKRCQILEEHFYRLAHTEKSFLSLSIHAENAPFLSSKFGVKVLPQILLFQDKELADTVVGFDAFGGQDSFKTKTLAQEIETLFKRNEQTRL